MTMKLSKFFVTLVSLTNVTGFVIIASPKSHSSVSSMQLGESDPAIQFEQDGHEFTASEADVEKVKRIVAQRVVEEQRLINKTVQKALQ